MIRAVVTFGFLVLCLATARVQAREQVRDDAATGIDLSLAGRIVAAEGCEVATVALWKTADLDGNPPDPYLTKRQTPDAGGEFRFEGLTPGYYAIAPHGRVSTGGVEQSFNYYMQWFVLRPEELEPRIELSVPPDGFTLRGRILHGDVPLPGIRVLVESETPKRRNHFNHYSDDQGVFVIRGLGTGRHTLSLEMHDTGNGVDPTQRRDYPSFRYSLDVQGDLERDFQYRPGHDAEIAIEFAPDYEAGFADRFDRALLLHSDQSHRLPGQKNISGGNIPTRMASAAFNGNAARFTGNFQGEYYVELAGSNGHASLLVPVPLELDALNSNARARLRVPAPGRIQARLELQGGSAFDFSETGSFLTLEAMPFYVCTPNSPLFNRTVDTDSLPAGRYLLNVGDGGNGLMLSPRSAAVEVRPGKTAAVSFAVKPGRIIIGSVSSNMKASRMYGEAVERFELFSPEQIRIEGPRNFEFAPPQELTPAMLEKGDEHFENRKSFGFYTGFVLFDPPPGAYTAQITAENHERLIQSFEVEEGPGAEWIEFGMRAEEGNR